MEKHYSNEFKQQVLGDYNSDKYGCHHNLAKHYNVNKNTL